MRPTVFLRLRLRLSLRNTVELLNPDSLTPAGTKSGGWSFGDPELIDSYDLMRDLNELVFEVRNLTDNDREEGLRYRQSVLDGMKSAGWREVNSD